MTYELRTREEIHAQIREIKAGWHELKEKAPDSFDVMKENLMGQLQALYWVLGHSRQSAIDSASMLTGGDPIDWS